jgi:uncharacterized membrane protein
MARLLVIGCTFIALFAMIALAVMHYVVWLNAD